MAKMKVKNIDYLANELKTKFNTTTTSNLKIGVVCCLDKFSTNSYALALANTVSREIFKQGMDAEIITLPAINERFINYANDNYVINAYKKLIADFLELNNYEKSLDGVVFIPSGFNCTLGCLASSIRLNLPTLVLPQGLSKKEDGANLEDILAYPGKIADGSKSVFDLENSQNNFSEYAGSGSRFTTENIFNIILEIMELVPKNSATTFAQTYEKENQAVSVGKTIVEITKNRLPLKRMINRKSIANAFMLNFCLGGSPAVINGLMYLAKEAELELDINKVLGTIKNVPVLFNTNSTINSYIENGGTWGLIKAMVKAKIIDGNYKTFADTTLLEETKKISNYENFTTPIKKECLVVLRGNIAERFALAKTINISEDKTKIITNAQVFNSDEEACNAILNKALTDNSAIIIKECGKNVETKGSSIYQTVIALESMGLTSNHIVITDGFVADDTQAICISCVTPDSDAGNIRYIKDGDEIEIDFVKGKLNVDISSKEWALRQKKYVKEKRELPKYLG